MKFRSSWKDKDVREYWILFLKFAVNCRMKTVWLDIVRFVSTVKGKFFNNEQILCAAQAELVLPANFYVIGLDRLWKTAEQAVT